MNLLFDTGPFFPEGFQYHPDFLSPGEELELLETLRQVELHNFQFQGFEARRRVASFGYDFSFENRRLLQGRAIPEIFKPLIRKTAAKLSLCETNIAELLITEYPPGSVINWHRDAPPFGLVAGISLGADGTFRLRPQDKALHGKKSVISLPVARRSLYVIDGPSGSDWQHSTAPVTGTRYSITLRTLKGGILE